MRTQFFLITVKVVTYIWEKNYTNYAVGLKPRKIPLREC